MLVKVRSVLLIALVALLVVPVAAVAHEERSSMFPAYDRDTTVPTVRSIGDAADVLVVCKPDSATRIAAITDVALRSLNEQLIDDCAFEHIQAAVDAVTTRGTNIYVLPGEYHEEPSTEAACAASYDGGLVTYEQMRTCGEVVNLITVAGDPDGGDDPDPETFDPATQDDLIRCDSVLCDLQIHGTGVVPQDTKVIGGFDEDGDWRKHNGIKADRADGFVLTNMAFELFRENAIYVHETSGYLLDRVEANYNDLYGILTFTSDRGIISNCETHHNGDSGVYPGSAADVNQGDNPATGALTRWSVEIFGCDTYNNALGFSGTAGNSVYFHDNLVHHNGAGYVTDSFVGGHPGMPQDHSWLENNRIYANNVNYYKNVQGENAPCHEARPVDRGHQDGVVCPAFPVPVGTGVLIAGGNSNYLRNNVIYDNWRQGIMSFYVPAAIRYQGAIQEATEAGDLAKVATLTAEYQAAEGDTSHDNHFVSNTFGLHPDGYVQPNGEFDVWWDDQGTGNCWQDNTSTADGGTPSNNANLGLPDCDSGGSTNPVPDPTKSGVLIPCAEYHRDNNPEPEGCDWYTDPVEPAGREAAPGEDGDLDGSLDGEDGTAGGSLAATGGGGLVALLGLGALIGAGRLRRRDEDAVDVAPSTGPTGPDAA